MWKIINKRDFVIFFGQLHTQEYKATKKQIGGLQLNGKKSKKSQTRLMSLCWKRKPPWRKNHHIIVILALDYVFFLFIGYHYESVCVCVWEGGMLKLGVQVQGGGRILDIDGQGGGGGGGGGSWKLDSFHGRHLCIIPNVIYKLYIMNLTYIWKQRNIFIFNPFVFTHRLRCKILSGNLVESYLLYHPFLYMWCVARFGTTCTI